MNKIMHLLKESKNLMNHLIIKIIIIIVLVAAVIFDSSWFGKHTVPVQAADSSLTYTVDYVYETITLKSTGSIGNSKYYMSTDGMKTWDIIEDWEIPGGTIDISSLLSTKTVTVYFKGNVDKNPIKVDLQAEYNDTLFKPVYKIVNENGKMKGRIEFSATAPATVEFRKGPNGRWASVTSPMSTSMYETKGATLYFRIAPFDNSNGNIARRAGKVITIKIPKKPTAPNVKLDASKLCITGINKNMQYRMGDETAWTPITSITGSAISITSFPKMASADGPISGGIIEFYTPGNDKKLNSAIKVITINPQPVLTGVIAELNGSTLKIIDPDQTKVYEYTVVPQTGKLDYMKARWSQITAKKEVKIPKANIGDTIFIRLKSYTEKTSGQVILPSTFINLTIQTLTP